MKPPSARTCLLYMPFQINIDPLKLLSGLEERKNRRDMILGFTLTTRWLVILFINRISQVVRFHKMALVTHSWKRDCLSL